MKHHFKRERVLLDAIVFDAGTQIRVAINEQVVTDYAEHMTEGVEFPPVVLFHDGVRYYLADGFHRTLAAKRNQFRDVEADIAVGTRADALWFALGANRANGQRLTEADKKHAVDLAIAAFPDHSGPRIAEQVGCSQQYVQQRRARMDTTSSKATADVVGRDGKSYPARTSDATDKRASIQEMVAAGESNERIRRALRVSPNTVVDVKRAMGIPARDQTRAAVAARRTRIREMAEAGYTGHQIAQAVDLSVDGTRAIAKHEGIDIPADRVVGKIKRHDPNRIVAQIVADAENLTEGVDLIDFAGLDRAQIVEWLTSLQDSRNKLGGFIRRLMKEQQHGEAA